MNKWRSTIQYDICPQRKVVSGVRDSESKGPDLELHLRLLAVETHRRKRDSAEVPRNLLLCQLELEGREQNRQDDL